MLFFPFLGVKPEFLLTGASGRSEKYNFYFYFQFNSLI